MGLSAFSTRHLIFGSKGSKRELWRKKIQGQGSTSLETVLSDTSQFLLTCGLNRVTSGRIQSTEKEWKNSTKESSRHGLCMCTKKLTRGQEPSCWEHSVSVENVPRGRLLASPEPRGPGQPSGLGE